MANGDNVFISNSGQKQTPSNSGQQQTPSNNEQHDHPAAWSVKAVRPFPHHAEPTESSRVLCS